MKAFASWRGGKDAMLALHRFNKKENCNVDFLLNMCDESGGLSKSHGLKAYFIQNQAQSLGVELVQQLSSNSNYRQAFIDAVLSMKSKGVEAGVFGDIFLNEHRVWIEEVCKEVGIEPIFPLWGEDTTKLLEEFIANEFKSVIVSVNEEKLGSDWLGRIIDNDFYTDILKLENIDPCAEYGEYHSFVYDGPIFKQEVNFNTGKIYKDERYTYIEME